MRLALFYKKSSSVIFGRFSAPARSIAFFSARSHCSGSASFRVFNAVSDTPNSRCFRHRNHTPSKVPGSISSASALQIGHIVIATPLVVVIMRWIGSKYDTPAGRLEASYGRLGARRGERVTGACVHPNHQPKFFTRCHRRCHGENHKPRRKARSN